MIFYYRKLKKINEANKELDAFVGTRTKMMLFKLKKVEELPTAESADLLGEAIEIEEDENQDN